MASPFVSISPEAETMHQVRLRPKKMGDKSKNIFGYRMGLEPTIFMSKSPCIDYYQIGTLIETHLVITLIEGHFAARRRRRGSAIL